MSRKIAPAGDIPVVDVGGRAEREDVAPAALALPRAAAQVIARPILGDDRPMRTDAAKDRELPIDRSVVPLLSRPPPAVANETDSAPPAPDRRRAGRLYDTRGVGDKVGIVVARADDTTPPLSSERARAETTLGFNARIALPERHPTRGSRDMAAPDVPLHDRTPGDEVAPVTAIAMAPAASTMVWTVLPASVEPSVAEPPHADVTAQPVAEAERARPGRLPGLQAPTIDHAEEIPRLPERATAVSFMNLLERPDPGASPARPDGSQTGTPQDVQTGPHSGAVIQERLPVANQTVTATVLISRRREALGSPVHPDQIIPRQRLGTGEPAPEWKPGPETALPAPLGDQSEATDASAAGLPAAPWPRGMPVVAHPPRERTAMPDAEVPKERDAPLRGTAIAPIVAHPIGRQELNNPPAEKARLQEHPREETAREPVPLAARFVGKSSEVVDRNDGPAALPAPDLNRTEAPAEIPATGSADGRIATMTPARPAERARRAAADDDAMPAPMQQVAQAVRALRGAAGTVGHVAVDLHPAELGQVKLSVSRSTITGDRIEITVARADTLALLRADAPALHQALDAAGFSTVNREVTFQLAAPEAMPDAMPAGRGMGDAGQSGSGDGAGRPFGQGGEGRAGSGTRGLAMADDAVALPPPPARRRSAGLDITA